MRMVKLSSCQYLLKSWRFDRARIEKVDITEMIEIAYWKMRCLVGGIRVLLEYAGAGKLLLTVQAFIGF